MSLHISSTSSYATTIHDVVERTQDKVDSLREKIERVEKDVCEYMMLGDTPKEARKLTPEEYLELDYKL